MADVGEIISRINFCGCGEPERPLRILMKALDSLESVEDSKLEWRYEQKIKPFLQTDEGWFIYYALDSWGLTEHGSCLPGWLTDDGETLLLFLRETACDPKKWLQAEEDFGNDGVEANRVN